MTDEKDKIIANLREVRKQLIELKKKDGNEADTRRVIDRSILEMICGYDPFKHISREDSVEGSGEMEFADFTIRLKPDKVALVIEVKRIGVDLAKRHVNQAERYAGKLGCQWIVITNGRQWQCRHWNPSSPEEMPLVAEWDFISDSTGSLMEKFALISLAGMKSRMLEKLWKKEQALTPRALVKSILSESTIRCLQSVLRKQMGHRPNPDDVVSAMRKIFNEQALKIMGKINITLPPANKAAKHTTKKD